jgi:hypothetical protein
LLLLLGSLLVTGLGFLIASVAHDLMSVMGWGIVAIVAMSLPAFSVLLPGLTTGWVRAIPSYYLVDAMNQVLNYGAGWAEVSGHLLALALFAALFLALGDRGAAKEVSMSLRRIGVLLGKELIWGPKGFLFIMAVAAPLILSLADQSARRHFFSGKPRLGVFGGRVNRSWWRPARAEGLVLEEVETEGALRERSQ